MSGFQSKSRRSNVRLLDNLASPVTGVLPGAVTASFLKADGLTFSAKSLDSDNWIEIGGGDYAIVWSSDDMSVLGPFLYKISGGSFVSVRGEFDIDPAPINLSASAQICVVSGNIVDLGGQAGTFQNLNFRLVKSPASSGSSLVAATIVRTVPDFFGNFSVALVRGVNVIVELDQVGLRHQFTVPDQETAELLDLLPPLP